MMFMGRRLTSSDGGKSWVDYHQYPFISFGLCVDGTWFASISFRRINGPTVRQAKSLRACKYALRKKVRDMRAELESLK